MPHEFLDHAWQGFTTMGVGFGSIIITLCILFVALRNEKKHQASNHDGH